METIDLYKKLLEFSARGDEAGAQEYIAKHFSELPEDVQGEIMTRLYFSAVEDELEEKRGIMQMQKEGIDAIRVLEMLKKQLEIEAAKNS